MEYRELYDENRQPLGMAMTKGEPVPPNAYMLTVGIWIVNDQKQILLTRRSLEKRYAPGMRENPAGHVQKGETCDVKWVTLDELDRMLQSGEMAASTLAHMPFYREAFERWVK